MDASLNPRETVALKHPITVEGVAVSVLHLRRPKVRDRLAAEKLGKTDAEKELALIALLAEVTPETLHELDMADYTAVQQAFAGFSDARVRGQATGRVYRGFDGLWVRRNSEYGSGRGGAMGQ